MCTEGAFCSFSVDHFMLIAMQRNTMDFFPINHFTPSESSLTRSVYLTSPGNPGPVMSDDILYALKRITVAQMINNTLP